MKQILRLCIFAVSFGSIVIPRAAADTRLKIGVFGLFHPKVLVFAAAPGNSLKLEGGGISIDLEDGQSVRCDAAHDLIVCSEGERVIRARVIHAVERDRTGGKFILSIPRKITRSFTGDLDIHLQGSELVPVVEMNLEVAVASAVAAESPPEAPIEALKAQAVCTRSYYLAARHRHRNFDFCDTTHCQFLRDPPAADSPAAMATALTRGVVLLYRGVVVPALFSASCGGRTRTLRETGFSSSGGYPYFAVPCRPCLRHAQEWRIQLDRERAAPLVAEEGSENARLLLDRKVGWEAIPSNNYSLESDGDAVVLTGRGSGHGIGLCQFGATGYADRGWNFKQILSHYFPDTTLAASSAK